MADHWNHFFALVRIVVIPGICIIVLTMNITDTWNQNSEIGIWFYSNQVLTTIVALYLSLASLQMSFRAFFRSISKCSS